METQWTSFSLFIIQCCADFEMDKWKWKFCSWDQIYAQHIFVTYISLQSNEVQHAFIHPTLTWMMMMMMMETRHWRPKPRPPPTLVHMSVGFWPCRSQSRPFWSDPAPLTPTQHTHTDIFRSSSTSMSDHTNTAPYWLAWPLASSHAAPCVSGTLIAARDGILCFQFAKFKCGKLLPSCVVRK